MFAQKKVQGVQNRTVEEKDDGIRLDKWFKLYFPNLKFGHLQKLMRSGQVRVDSKRIKGGTRIATGQKIRIPPLDADAISLKKRETPTNQYQITADERRQLDQMIIFEDENIFAVNKPSGLSVQGGSKQRKHLDGMLAAHAKETGGERPHLVHRLDKDTSGVLILSRNDDGARKLGKLFQDRNMEKYYWALCLGKPEHNSGDITAPLAKHSNADFGEYMRQDDVEGKYARTYYHVIEQLGKRACWIAFRPITGRTHQIRVHAALMGCPIIGEDKYADFEEQELFEEILPNRKEIKLHLHAKQLILPNPFPAKGRSKRAAPHINISAPLPAHMRKSWDDLGLDDSNINNEDYFSGI